MEIKSLRGMNDILPPDIYAWIRAEKIIRDQFEAFGYSEVRTPVMESTALFSRSVGDATDIVKKEMYTFTDRGEESVTLRPEGTAPVVRAVLEQNLLNIEPLQKLFYFGPMFRYERPQKGRYRQFHQYGIEVFGVSDPLFDAELISMLVDLFRKLGLNNLNVELSSLGCKECRPSYRDKLLNFLKPIAAQLCKECQDRMQHNPLRVLDCKNPSCQGLTSAAPSVVDVLCQGCDEHFQGVQKGLGVLKTPFHLNKRLVRGLDYYNRTVFEVTSQDLGAQNAVGGGGRYDDLVGQLGGQSCPAIGFAGGFERLILLMQAQGAVQPERPKLFFVCPDEEGRKISYPLAFRLRQQGIFVELDYQGKSMKAQMKKADKHACEFVLILGGGEIQKGIAVLRDMKTKNQEEISLTSIEEDLLRRLK